MGERRTDAKLGRGEIKPKLIRDRQERPFHFNVPGNWDNVEKDESEKQDSRDGFQQASQEQRERICELSQSLIEYIRKQNKGKPNGPVDNAYIWGELALVSGEGANADFRFSIFNVEDADLSNWQSVSIKPDNTRNKLIIDTDEAYLSTYGGGEDLSANSADEIIEYLEANSPGSANSNNVQTLSAEGREVLKK